LALAGFELLFAGWLFWNARPIWAHRASICLVGVFALTSLYSLLKGEPDCGCFGKVTVHPAWTFSLDVFLLLALCYSAIGNETGGDRSSVGWISHLRRPALGVLSPLAIAAVICAVLWHVSSAKSVLMGLTQGVPLISIDPSPKATFQARQGDTVKAKFMVRNITRQPLRLLGANTSCICTIVEQDLPMDLEPGESKSLTVQMRVGAPRSDGTFKQEAELLVNRAGKVPPLVIEAMVSQK
jgi:hypothetical protein